jgi:protein gp37
MRVTVEQLQQIPLFSGPALFGNSIVAEPLLGSINLEISLVESDVSSLWIELIDWVVVGGESGSHFRPLDLEAVRALQRQCERWDTAFFFKQIGGLRPSSNGDLLDGVQYHQMPKIKGSV